MMPPILLILAGLAAFGFVEIFVEAPDSKGLTCGNQNCKLIESQLRKNAQEALNAIKSKRVLSASYNRADRGQHVFNNGLLKFHRSVLQVLLEDVGGYDEQLENLVQDLMIPLSQSQQHSISSTMVVHFRSDEFYVDFNADVFGEYVKELRTKLVAYLKADTSPNQNDRYGIQETRHWIFFIGSQMANLEVYVDPMARDRWLNQNQNHHADYKMVRDALKNCFQNIRLAFEKASEKIRVFRKRNNWSLEKQ